MSHGAGGGDGAIRAEPDLTPMLDLVMQLLMYFIMCVNFIGEEVNENVQLPPATAAKPIDKSEGDVLFVNVNKEGKVLVLGQDPMDLSETTKWLNDRVMEAPKDERGNPKTAVVIRADQGTDYASVYGLLDLCKQKKFSKFKVRATMVGG
jgi:biopolymer transport protein ExbD